MKGEPVVPPIVHSATYRFDSTEDLVDVVNHRTGYIYSRWDNPTVRAVERLLAEIEETDESVAFASGMAAITTAILAYVRPGDRIAAMATYGETIRFLTDYLPSMGVDVSLYGAEEAEACERRIAEGVRLVYLETPMNPLLRVLDVGRWTAHAHAHDALVFLDATFASPVNLRSRRFGVDVILHSATKYLGGHHDVVAGFACCEEEIGHRIWMQRRMLGGVLDPTQAYLIWRGIQTLDIRVARQNETAERIARWLCDRPEVMEVHYPGLERHPDHAVATRVLCGFGGMVSLELATDYAGAARFVDRLRVFKLATSLGGVTSLANQSVTNTHASMTQAERADAGIRDSLVRLSIGLEPADALIEDLEQALSGA